MISQALVLFGVIFTLVVLALRFGGNRAILAGSEESGIKDLAKLNQWASRRFLLLPLIAFGFAPFSLNNTAVGILALMVLLFAALGVIVWISVGARQFKNQ